MDKAEAGAEERSEAEADKGEEGGSGEEEFGEERDDGVTKGRETV
jgi:hypothetical protein